MPLNTELSGNTRPKVPGLCLGVHLFLLLSGFRKARWRLHPTHVTSRTIMEPHSTTSQSLLGARLDAQSCGSATECTSKTQHRRMIQLRERIQIPSRLFSLRECELRTSDARGNSKHQLQKPKRNGGKSKETAGTLGKHGQTKPCTKCPNKYAKKT